MAAIAELSAIPYRTYQDIESGTRWPRVENLESIAGALGVTVSRLFRDESEMQPEDALRILTRAVHLGHTLREESIGTRVQKVLDAHPEALPFVLAVISPYESKADKFSKVKG